MKAMVESTTRLVDVGVRKARVWTGTTEAGVPFQLLVFSVAVVSKNDQLEFDRDLVEQHAPAPEICAFPLRMIL